MLAQPIARRLEASRRILLAGCGGGYDVLGAVPLLAELTQEGREVHLASLSFAHLETLAGADRLVEQPNLFAVRAACATADRYCPEAWLARWLGETTGYAEPVWCFEKTGVRPLVDAYRLLVRRLEIDTIVLVDGGVDSLLRGDESSLGTPAEDLVSLAAVAELDGVERILACVGLGAELADGIVHAQVLERIAGLAARGAYLGAASLVRGQPSTDFYLTALDYIFAQQSGQRTSHIHTVIKSAVCGDFGPRGKNVWLSPLSPIYWFFSLPDVAATHLFLQDLTPTHDIGQVTLLIEGLRRELTIRDREAIPL
jgi:hypothetical protein